jgi:chaperonin GroEL (HSP60 family)
MINQKIHPQTIVAGLRQAVNVAKDALTAATFNHKYVSNLHFILHVHLSANFHRCKKIRKDRFNYN